MHLSIKFVAKIFSTLQNLVFLKIFQQYAATTTHSMKKIALSFYNRISQYKHDLNTKVILATPRNIPNFPPWSVPIITIDTDLRKYDKKQHIKTLTHLNPCSGSCPIDTHIYTNGSKTQNGTGYSIVYEHSTTKVKCHQDTSILTAELKHANHI